MLSEKKNLETRKTNLSITLFSTVVYGNLTTNKYSVPRTEFNHQLIVSIQKSLVINVHMTTMYDTFRYSDGFVNLGFIGHKGRSKVKTNKQSNYISATIIFLFILSDPKV